ncbi:hypothetical protein GIB67_009208 [Kingdonia uniflora]|uniref:Uncharacterized protein n=1 Tax=Kingdonia uniflora TaxID=39325 RepID=A0A7J7N298_9MAGN|nr:hypothetical protein GIB67_009208 [Kingdonia uniflora]
MTMAKGNLEIIEKKYNNDNRHKIDDKKGLNNKRRNDRERNQTNDKKRITNAKPKQIK